jgi:glycosyltransferase involved in cell wall biosynthesis
VRESVRVALLTNCLPTYRVPLFTHLKERVQHLRIFLSAKVVPDRDWHMHWGDLDVTINRTFRWVRQFRNVHGFVDQFAADIPYDTVWTLWRYRPDVVISSEFGARTLFAAIYKLLSPRTKLIIWATLSEHTEATRGKRREFIRRCLLRHADGVFVNGASGKRYVQALGFNNGPISFVPYTVDNQVFQGPDTRSGEEPLKLLFTGQLVERKGLCPFLTQLALWCENHPTRHVTLSIVGNGPELNRLQSILLPANLKLTFEGVASFRELPSHYHRADIYVFPTLADEWGVVVNEALNAGLPILGSRYSQAVEELVEEGESGWLFTPSDTQDIYAAIDRALQTDSASLDSMRRHAITAIAELTPYAIADVMVDTVRQIK